MSASETELASFHAIVRGRVQGVFFRAFVKQQARALGLAGYVRNMRQFWESRLRRRGIALSWRSCWSISAKVRREPE